MKMISPTSQPPNISTGRRRRGTAGGADSAMDMLEAVLRPAAMPAGRRAGASVLEALADSRDVVLRHQLGAGVEVRRRDAAVDLQVELHHRPEALQEGLLPERAGERAGVDALELLRPEVVAKGADL